MKERKEERERETGIDHYFTDILAPPKRAGYSSDAGGSISVVSSLQARRLT